MFFTSSQQACSHDKSHMAALPDRLRVVAPDAKPERCGWYDSSFDLVTGLDITEQDNHMLYQLWALSNN